jgi:hypothetical protein
MSSSKQNTGDTRNTKSSQTIDPNKGGGQAQQQQGGGKDGGGQQQGDNEPRRQGGGFGQHRGGSDKR